METERVIPCPSEYLLPTPTSKAHNSVEYLGGVRVALHPCIKCPFIEQLPFYCRWPAENEFASTHAMYFTAKDEWSRRKIVLGATCIETK